MLFRRYCQYLCSVAVTAAARPRGVGGAVREGTTNCCRLLATTPQRLLSNNDNNSNSIDVDAVGGNQMQPLDAASDDEYVFAEQQATATSATRDPSEMQEGNPDADGEYRDGEVELDSSEGLTAEAMQPPLPGEEGQEEYYSSSSFEEEEEGEVPVAPPPPPMEEEGIGEPTSDQSNLQPRKQKSDISKFFELQKTYRWSTVEQLRSMPNKQLASFGRLYLTVLAMQENGKNSFTKRKIGSLGLKKNGQPVVAEGVKVRFPVLQEHVLIESVIKALEDDTMPLGAAAMLARVLNNLPYRLMKEMRLIRNLLKRFVIKNVKQLSVQQIIVVMDRCAPHFQRDVGFFREVILALDSKMAEIDSVWLIFLALRAPRVANVRVPKLFHSKLLRRLLEVQYSTSAEKENKVEKLFRPRALIVTLTEFLHQGFRDQPSAITILLKTALDSINEESGKDFFKTHISVLIDTLTLLHTYPTAWPDATTMINEVVVPALPTLSSRRLEKLLTVLLVRNEYVTPVLLKGLTHRAVNAPGLVRSPIVIHRILTQTMQLIGNNTKTIPLSEEFGAFLDGVCEFYSTEAMWALRPRDLIVVSKACAAAARKLGDGSRLLAKIQTLVDSFCERTALFVEHTAAEIEDANSMLELTMNLKMRKRSVDAELFPSTCKLKLLRDQICNEQYGQYAKRCKSHSVWLTSIYRSKTINWLEKKKYPFEGIYWFTMTSGVGELVYALHLFTVLYGPVNKEMFRIVKKAMEAKISSPKVDDATYVGYRDFRSKRQATFVDCVEGAIHKRAVMLPVPYDPRALLELIERSPASELLKSVEGLQPFLSRWVEEEKNFEGKK